MNATAPSPDATAEVPPAKAANPDAVRLSPKADACCPVTLLLVPMVLPPTAEASMVLFDPNANELSPPAVLTPPPEKLRLPEAVELCNATDSIPLALPPMAAKALAPDAFP